MARTGSNDVKGTRGRVAELLAQGAGVQAAVRAFAREALGESAMGPTRMLEVARAIRAGIAGASRIGDAESQAAAEEALAGLAEALTERYARLELPAEGVESRCALDDAEALQREFGSASKELATYITRLRRASRPR